MSTITESTAHDWILLEQMAFNDWLIIDLGQQRLVGDGAIGRVRCTEGIFTATRFVAPTEVESFATLHLAIDAFAPGADRQQAPRHRECSRVGS